MDDRPYVDEDEIDLRELALSLWRHRWVIGGVTAAAVLVAAAVSAFVLPPMYESQALLVITRPQVQAVDPNAPGFRVGELAVAAPLIPPELPGEAVAALANSPTIREEVARRTGVSMARLKRLLRAQPVRNTNIVELRVRFDDPRQAQKVATVWAEVVAGRSKVVFLPQAESVYKFFDRQLQAALTRLRLAEQELRRFNATSRIDEIRARISQLTGQLASYEARRNDLTVDLKRTERELQAIEAQLRRQPQNYALSKSITTDPFLHETAVAVSGQQFLELSRLKLRTEERNPVYNALAQARAEAAVRVQSLVAQKSNVERLMQEIESEIARLRTELADQLLRQSRVTREVENAKQVYDTLFRRREEARIVVAIRAGTVEVAVPASLPSEPVSPRPALNAAVAGTLAFLVAALGVLVRDAWAAAPERRGKGAEVLPEAR